MNLYTKKNKKIKKDTHAPYKAHICIYILSYFEIYNM